LLVVVEMVLVEGGMVLLVVGEGVVWGAVAVA